VPSKLLISFIIFFLSPVTCHLSPALYADTIYTNDGKEVKGIMVEDYKDRIKLSTPDGEIILMKKDIRELYMDTEEDNLIKLAEQASERSDYSKAYGLYEKALKINSDSKRARDGVVFLQGMLFRKDQAIKEDAVRRQEELEQAQGAIVPAGKTEEKGIEEDIEKLKKTLGITVRMDGSFPTVGAISAESVAYEAGMRQGDKIVGVWGRLTGYLSLKEVMAMLLEKSSLELKLTIERDVDLALNPRRNILTGMKDLIGASLNMDFDGLVVSNVASPDTGLRQSDLIVAINGKSTRYMPLKSAVKAIRTSKGGTVRLTIRREMLIWRKDWS